MVELDGGSHTYTSLRWCKVTDKEKTCHFSKAEEEGQDRGTEGHTILPSALMQDSSTQVQLATIERSI